MVYLFISSFLAVLPKLPSYLLYSTLASDCRVALAIIAPCVPFPCLTCTAVRSAATVVTGAYRLAEKANKRPAITDEQAVKFANYLVNRKAIQSVKGAYHLVNGLTMFCTNKVSRGPPQSQMS